MSATIESNILETRQMQKCNLEKTKKNYLIRKELFWGDRGIKYNNVHYKIF